MMPDDGSLFVGRYMRRSDFPTGSSGDVAAHDIGVGEHRALGKPRRAAGELDQGGILRGERDAGELCVGAAFDQFGKMMPAFLQFQAFGRADARIR